MSLSKLKDPEAVLAALREFDHLGRTAFLAKYKFGKSREYMLRDERTGNLYDSKAIVAAAYGHAFPDEGPLRSDDFSGGEATVERKLNDLGFEVVRIGEDWSAEEVDLAVADYFGMLSDEARGAAVNKSAHNERLRLQLKVRSKSSIELKHQNISAVLDDLGLPYIRGYKPRGNLQELLRTTVHAYIDRHRSELGRVVDDFEERTEPGEAEYRTVVVAPPAVDAPSPNLPRPRLPRKFDFAERDQRNRKLGHSGERWAFGYERFRVGDEGRSDLVECIRWVSEQDGDGAGYDILSFEHDASKRYIEVKTTNGGPLTPFVVTRNEVEFSAEVGGAFHLYRLFEFAERPRLFVLKGPLAVSVQMEAIDFRARLKAA